MRRLSVLSLVLAMLCASALWVLPRAERGLTLRLAAEEPGALADLRLAQSFDAEVAAREIAAALAADDLDLAESFLALAQARGVAVAEDLRARVMAARSVSREVRRIATRFGHGFITGEPEGLAGFAGAASADLSLFGDLRDLAREGWRTARGEKADGLIAGLAAFGLVVTAGTYASFGEAAPLRAGVSLVKAARRTGRIGVNLVSDFGRIARAGRGERIAAAFSDLSRIERKAGARTALEGMRYAENVSDLSRLGRLAEAKGRSTLAVLKTLGRGALVIGAGAVTAALWVLGATTNIFLLMIMLSTIFAALVRRLWPAARYAGVKIAAAVSPIPQNQVMTVYRQ
jgi:hypothetical protein